MKKIAANSFLRGLVCKNVFTVQKEAGSERAASEKKIKDMKCRKINYVDEGFDTLASEMSADPKAILRLKPVNYYAIKNKYIMGKVYTSEDYQENYVQFFRYEYDHECGKTDIFPLSAELMSKALAKVGIIIDLKALAKDQ